MPLSKTFHPRERIPHLGHLVLGGAGFSNQLVNQSQLSDVIQIVDRAFDLGVRVIDTSPYYEPSEQLLGAALADPFLANSYARQDYTIMTKVGRITASEFDYTPRWIRQSVARSLERFHTDYLDVVFCHDVEFVSREEAVQAVGVLFELQKAGVIRNVGISGYNIQALTSVAMAVVERFRRPLDVVQNWAQMTIQNTRLESAGLGPLHEAGIHTIFSSSPLAIGLLREGGVPEGSLGDWHPAPSGLRLQSQRAAEFMRSRNESFSGLALRYAIRRAIANSTEELQISTITGISSLAELEENFTNIRRLLSSLEWQGGEYQRRLVADSAVESGDEYLVKQVRAILGRWVDYDFMEDEACYRPKI